MKIVLVLVVLVSVIFINHAFAQGVSVDSKAEQNPLEVIIVPAIDSGTSGCEETTDGCYIPKKAIIPIGGKVIFSNIDAVEHTFTADITTDGMLGIFDSGLISAGSSYEWVPTDVGEFPYHCTVHPWMKGTIFVEEKQIPPKDTDGDGISDSVDKCPTDPETVNGFEDTDGCPDVVPPKDTDGDGIPDSTDSCPTQPETINGFQDTDGCPDVVPPKDTDGDGIPDSTDSCPTQPETINGYQDTDGCPDVVPPKDTDGDGIPDSTDSCPTQPETINGYQDTDGCPDKVESKDDPILIYAVIGIGVAGTGAVIGIKLHGKGSGGNDTKKIESDKQEDDRDTSPHVEVRITGGIEK